MERDFHYIHKAMGQFPEIKSGILFGSRALGNQKKGSDVDLAVIGEGVSHRVMNQLDDLLNEVYPLPYIFDLHHYESLSNKKLKQHIDSVGKEIYTNEPIKKEG